MLTAHAQVVEFTSQSSLAPNDVINWAQPDGTPVPVGTVLSGQQTVLSSLGLTASLTSPSDSFYTGQQNPGGNINGNFSPGAALLYIQEDSSATFTFASPVSAAGLQFAIDAVNGSFTAQVTAYATDGGVLGSFSENGETTTAGDNSAIFLGIGSSSANISSVTFSASPTGGEGFAISNLSLSDIAVPEPDTGVLTFAGVAGLISLRRIKHQRQGKDSHIE